MERARALVGVDRNARLTAHLRGGHAEPRRCRRLPEPGSARERMVAMGWIPPDRFQTNELGKRPFIESANFDTKPKELTSRTRIRMGTIAFSGSASRPPRLQDCWQTQ